MSHCLGVRCGICHATLHPDTCPERGCPGGHGYGDTHPSEWAASTWPDHACFQRASTADTEEQA